MLVENLVYVVLPNRRSVQIDLEVLVLAVKEDTGPIPLELEVLRIWRGTSLLLVVLLVCGYCFSLLLCSIALGGIAPRRCGCAETQLHKEFRGCAHPPLAENGIQDAVLVAMRETPANVYF